MENSEKDTINFFAKYLEDNNLGTKIELSDLQIDKFQLLNAQPALQGFLSDTITKEDIIEKINKTTTLKLLRASSNKADYILIGRLTGEANQETVTQYVDILTVITKTIELEGKKAILIGDYKDLSLTAKTWAQVFPLASRFNSNKAIQHTFVTLGKKAAMLVLVAEKLPVVGNPVKGFQDDYIEEQAESIAHYLQGN